MKRFPFTLLAWHLPVPFISLVCAIALWQGIDHPWLITGLLVTIALNILMAIFCTSLSISLHHRLSERDEDYQRIQESYQYAENSRRQLQNEIERLSGMRAINMSSQIESFSELLKSALTITHFSTEAKSLTLFLESRDQIGSIHPKAHIRWENDRPNVPSQFYIYFDGEIILSQSEENVLSGFRFRAHGSNFEQGQISGDLLYNGRQVGHFRAPIPHGQSEQAENILSQYLEEMDITTSGAFSSWQSRTSNNFSVGTHTFINVPIVSQSTVIGVLQAEFSGLHGEKRSMEEIVKLQGNLRDITVSIGQPLRKEQLFEQATKDAMTGLYNKALYGQQLHDHFHRCLRYQRPLAYIFLDIDHFKHINDQYGHLTGDIALKSVSRIIMDNIRQSDLAFRFGGEELCVLLPESSEEEGLSVAEKLRQIIENTEFPTDKDFSIHFTASFGVACTNSDMRDPSELAKLADNAVYHAKRTGRNRVIAASSLPTDIPENGSKDLSN